MNARRTWLGLAVCFLLVVTLASGLIAPDEAQKTAPSIDTTTRSYTSVTTPANA